MARHPWPSEHTTASLMDGACALKPCQTNFHSPAGGHDHEPKLDCDGELQLAEEQSNNFFPKAQLFRTKDLRSSKKLSALAVPILADKSGSKTLCHSLPLATTIQVTHMHCSVNKHRSAQKQF